VNDLEALVLKVRVLIAASTTLERKDVWATIVS
jgi:hypothetical protein